MSDTPRTDAAEIRCIDEPVQPLGMVEVEFARQLERELAAAKERIRRLEEAAREVYLDSIASNHTWTEIEMRNMHALRDVMEDKP